MQNAGLKYKLESRLPGRNIYNLRYANDTTLMAESEKELKSLLKVEGSENVGLKLNIQKTKIMTSSPITSWQTDGEQWQWKQRLFRGRLQKVTADGDCSHEIKRCLLLGRKVRPGFDPWVRKILWRRKWQPTAVSLPRKCHGQRSPVCYSPWGCKELDTTEQSLSHSILKSTHYFATKV